MKDNSPSKQIIKRNVKNAHIMKPIIAIAVPSNSRNIKRSLLKAPCVSASANILPYEIEFESEEIKDSRVCPKPSIP